MARCSTTLLFIDFFIYQQKQSHYVSFSWKYGQFLTLNIRRRFIVIIISPLTARVVGAPQMILQPVLSVFPCSPLPSGTCQTPGLSIPWCCLPTSSFVCLVFFPLSLCLARWFWPDLMNRKHDHTTAVCISVRRSSCGPIACWILVRTSSLVTWSLYEMASILR